MVPKQSTESNERKQFTTKLLALQTESQQSYIIVMVRFALPLVSRPVCSSVCWVLFSLFL